MKLIHFLLAFCLGVPCFSQPTSFSPRGIGGGGALFFPTINPANDNEYFISCDMSQLFHTVDFGNTYNQLHFNTLQVFGAASTYEFTNNPQIAYCNFNDGNEGYPVKTVNGGAGWTVLPGYDVGSYGQAYRMRANYSNPDQLLINSYGYIFFSNNGGTTFSVAKQTANNGAGLIMGGVFWDGPNIYIGTNEGLLVSHNSGASFSVMNTSGMGSGEVVWSFAGAKSNGVLRFFCISSAAANTYNGINPWEYYGHAKGVYSMDNADGVWSAKSTGIDFDSDFVMYVATAWNDVNTVYLGGSDGALSAPLVFKSADAGGSWTKVFKSANNTNISTGWSGYSGDKNWSWGETCFGISVAPFNSNKVMFGDFGFVHNSSDGGATWKQAYVPVADQHPAGAATPKNKAYHSIGLENTTCWQIFWCSPTVMMGCYSDIGGVRSTDGGAGWGYQYSGFSVNSLYRMVKAANGNVYGACSNIHDMYQSTRLADAQLDAADGNGKIVFSTDNGATWTNLHQFGHPVFWLATDPNNAERMYASVIHYGGTPGAQSGGIYVTQNLSAGAGSSWTKLPNPPRTQGHPASIVVLNDGKVLCTFSGRRSSSGFTNSSGVFLYDPSNNSWTDKSDPGMYYWTKDIVVDPNDPAQNTWYTCVFSGWGGPPNGLGGLYRTTNRGTSWTKLTGSQFDRVTSITFHPQTPTQAYLTTETQGLWVSNNISANVPSFSPVSAYPFRQPERVYFNPYNSDEMWVSSFGNGMRVGSMEVPVPSVTIATGATTICAGAPATFSATAANGGVNPAFQWKINGVNAATGNPFTTSSLANGDIVTCVMTIDAGGTPVTATSNAIAMTVLPVVTPTIQISASATTISPGTQVTFNALTTNAGPAPQFQWRINNTPVGGNSSQFTSSSLVSGDVVTCLLTGNAPCTAAGPVVSNAIVITVTSATSDLAGPESTVRVYPNPAGDFLYLLANEGITGADIRLYSIQGSLLRSWEGQDLPAGAPVMLKLDALPAGNYLISLRSDTLYQVWPIRFSP